MERNEFSSLPGGLLARGYVRSFATAVGLDPEETVAEFVAQAPLASVRDGYVGTTTTAVLSAPTDDAPSEATVVMGRWTPSGAVLGVAALALVFAATAALVVSAPQWSHLFLRQIGGHTPDGQLRAPDTGAASDRSDESTAQAGGPRSPVPLSAEPIARAVLFTLPQSINKTLPASINENSAVNTAAEAPVTGPIVVALSATRASWVIAIVDGQQAFSRLLEVGEQERIEARRDFVLTTGDAGAIVMSINGVAARSLGHAGETVKARVDRHNLGDYLVMSRVSAEAPITRRTRRN